MEKYLKYKERRLYYEEERKKLVRRAQNVGRNKEENVTSKKGKERKEGI